MNDQLKMGDVFFCKKLKVGTSKAAPEIQVQGHAFGIYLGYVKQTQRDPHPHELMGLMGACGFICFDDVHEFLGEEQTKLIIEKFDKKYEAQAVAAAPPMEEDKNKIVDLHGKPIEEAPNEPTPA